jgi:hypothetical protein
MTDHAPPTTSGHMRDAGAGLEPNDAVLFDIKLTAEEVSLIAAFRQEHDDEQDDRLRLTVGHGHSGYGLYASDADCPDEGAILLRELPFLARFGTSAVNRELLEALVLLEHAASFAGIPDKTEHAVVGKALVAARTVITKQFALEVRNG